ncbi:MAG: metallohydrolase [Pseudoxanthomonas spadix]|nr:MAG: metallohydrolase [Pseudoxanthomonas spadix]
MDTTISFFPVDNGDMALIRLNDPVQTAVLIDINIRQCADDPNDVARDVAADLRERLPIDALGRPYVDAFLLSHPDKDHCTGLEKHFYLGPLADYSDDDKPQHEKRIVIREMWSSPIVFRRASRILTLCSDAKAFRKEAKRRVACFRAGTVSEGDRILIMGEDKDGKTDDLGPILCKPGQSITTINGIANQHFSAHMLGPSLVCEDDEEVDRRAKNHSSVILNIDLASSPWGLDQNSCRFLTAGDAEVAIWERLWEKHQHTPEVLQYDVLETPHHCSWHVFSGDSWSELGEKAKASPAARSALSQARFGAKIISSSKPIKADDSDPPCIRAKREYQDILRPQQGTFLCTGETPQTWAPAPIDLEVTRSGVRVKATKRSGTAAIAAAAAPRAG